MSWDRRRTPLAFVPLPRMDVFFTIPAAAVLVPAALVLLTVLVVRVRREPGRYPPARLVLLVLAGGYALGVLYVTLLPIQVGFGRYGFQNEWYADIMPVPLVTADLRSFSLNVLMMVPFGVLLPLLRPHVRTVRAVAGRAALTSLAIEVTQLLSGWLLDNRHSVDINDVLANTIGAVLGLLCLRLAHRRWSLTTMHDAP